MAKAIDEQESHELSAFLGFFFDHYVANGRPNPPETHPLNVLRQIAERAPKRAFAGLKMAIGDLIEATSHWSPEQVKEADDVLRAAGIVTLSELRRRYSRRFSKIIKRCKILSEVDYYLVRGIVCDTSVPPDQLPLLGALLADYEMRQVQLFTRSQLD